jgi:hypothetical protein
MHSCVAYEYPFIDFFSTVPVAKLQQFVLKRTTPRTDWTTNFPKDDNLLFVWLCNFFPGGIDDQFNNAQK